MALDAREQRSKVAQIEQFERALRGAHNEPWWRNFITLMAERRQGCLEQLASGFHEQREEDRLRGEIHAYNWVLTLDHCSEQQPTKQELRDARRTPTDA